MARGLIEGKDARAYDEKISFSERTLMLDRFIAENVTKKGSRICDMCCGSGATIELLEDQVSLIVGVDASEEMINICKEKYGMKKNVRLINSSVSVMPLDSGIFDYVILRMGLHHIRKKEKVLDEAWRVLKADGKLILIDQFYTSMWKYYLNGIIDLLFRSKKHLLNHFIISKKANLALLDKFMILKEESPIEPGKTLTRIFMFVLEKK